MLEYKNDRSFSFSKSRESHTIFSAMPSKDQSKKTRMVSHKSNPVVFVLNTEQYSIIPLGCAEWMAHDCLHFLDNF